MALWDETDETPEIEDDGLEECDWDAEDDMDECAAEIDEAQMDTDEEYEVEEIYVDPTSGQVIVYDTDGNQHVEESEE